MAVQSIIFVLIDPFGHAKLRARRPSVPAGMTLVVLRCHLSPGAIKEIEVNLAEPAEITDVD